MTTTDFSKMTDINSLQHFNRYFFAKQLVSGEIIDVACGIGYGSEVMKGNYVKYSGIDVDEESVNVAQKSYISDDAISFSSGNICSLNFKDDSFDAAISFETLEHLKDPSRAIVELKRVLKPNGILVGSVPSKFYDDLISSNWKKNDFHVTQFLQKEINSLLKKEFEHVLVFCAEESIMTKFSLLRNDNVEAKEECKLFNYDSEDECWGSFIFVASNKIESLKKNEWLFNKELIKYSTPYMKSYTENIHPILLDNINFIQTQKKCIELLEEKIAYIDKSKFWRLRNLYCKTIDPIKNLLRNVANNPLLVVSFVKKFFRKIIRFILRTLLVVSVPIIRFYIKNTLSPRIAMVCSTGAVGGAEKVFAKHVEFLSKEFLVDAYFELSGGPVVGEVIDFASQTYIAKGFNEFNLANHKYLYLVQSLPDVALIKKLNPAIKISFILHDPVLWTEEIKKRNNVVEHIDHFFCISELIMKKLLESLPELRPEKVSVLHNSFSFGQEEYVVKKNTPAKSKSFVWGYAGRFSFEKNVAEIIETFGHFRKIHPESRLIIAGDISIKSRELKRYKKQIVALIEKNPGVEYWGYQSDLRDFYSKVDGIIMASFIEGISVAALDGLSYGIPVVSSDVGSMHEIISDGNNGILFPLDCQTVNPFNNCELNFSANDKSRFLLAMEKCWEKTWCHADIAENSINKFSAELIREKFIETVNRIILQKK